MIDKEKTQKIPFFFLKIFFLMLLFQSCSAPEYVHVSSLDGKFRFELNIENFQPVYNAYFNDKEIIKKSAMGFKFGNKKNVYPKMKISSVKTSKVEKGWEPLFGERNYYPENYNQAIVSFESEDQKIPPFQLNIRVYDEGIAFRYELNNTGPTVIAAELTEFAMPSNTDVWISSNTQGEIFKRKLARLKTGLVERPLLAAQGDSLYVAIGEAALVDFARMKFLLNKNTTGTLVANLDGEVRYNGDFNSPWRVIMAGNTAGEILENNYLFLNLNEPNKITNTDWIKPGKVLRDMTISTEGGMACIDFAEKHNIKFVEFDAGWYGNEYDERSDATTITPDRKRYKEEFDLKRLVKYGESKGIGVILYVNRRSLERQLDDVLPLFKSWGVKGIKYGFVNVGPQSWTMWLHDAIRKAADHEIMVDVHDEYRPTGFSRTYPNLITQEGIRGDEASPDNSMALKSLFVRMLAGAGDHTFCYFSNRVEELLGSHGSQLAKTVCFYSPWQFIFWYDQPLKHPTRPDYKILDVPELTFFDQLPTVWDDTKIIGGQVGEHAVVARKSGSTWFVGALNGIQPRNFKIPLDFLDPNTEYEATIFKDNEEVETFTKIGIENLKVTSKDVIEHNIGKNEGMALIIKKVTSN